MAGQKTNRSEKQELPACIKLENGYYIHELEGYTVRICMTGERGAGIVLREYLRTKEREDML